MDKNSLYHRPSKPRPHSCGPGKLVSHMGPARRDCSLTPQISKPIPISPIQKQFVNTAPRSRLRDIRQQVPLINNCRLESTFKSFHSVDNAGDSIARQPTYELITPEVFGGVGRDRPVVDDRPIRHR
jgi:hypothetical protein